MKAAGWTSRRIAAVITLAVAMVFGNVLPVIVGVLTRNLGFSPGELGGIASAAMLASTGGSLCTMALMSRISPRATVSLGLLLFGLANLTICAFPSPLPIVVLSSIAGFGSGLAMSSCYYVMGLDEQEKNSAASLLSKSAVAMLMITAIPLLTEQYGWRAMYVCLAALVIPCLILARHFPNEYLQGFRQDAQTTAESGERGIWILLATALSGISILMLWPYMDSLGADVGVPQGSINLALSLAAGSGFVSSALAMWAGRRITIPGVLLICMIVNLVGVLVTLLGSSTAFIAGVLMYYFTLPIYLSAQFGVAMRTAVSKRFGVTYSIVLHAATLGPALGGFIAHSLGFPALRVAYILVMATAFCIVWMENLRLRRAQLAQDCSGPATEHA